MNVSWDKKISATEETSPVTIEAMTPLAVVFFQKMIPKMAGKLADAAMANAQPTRKETFMALKKDPQNHGYNTYSDCCGSAGENHGVFTHFHS